MHTTEQSTIQFPVLLCNLCPLTVELLLSLSVQCPGTPHLCT